MITETYRPKAINDFIGLDKPKRAMRKLASNPTESSWLFIGPSGTGKTTLALAFAEAIGAQVHHIPSQQCDVETIRRVCEQCKYVPMFGSFHVVIVDEADHMSKAAELALLSRTDTTNRPANTIFIFTCNSTERFGDPFLSRSFQLEFSSYGLASETSQLLENVWVENAPKDASAPNFARLVKDAKNNIRAALMSLERELYLA